VDSSVILVIAIAAILAFAILFVLVTARRRASTGSLSRETRRRDASTPTGGTSAEAAAGEGTSTELVDTSAAARERADEARDSISGGVPVPAEGRTIAERQPVDEEELGITRRQFFNRGILAGVGVGVAGFGAASLAFIWPVAGPSGFGGKVEVGSLSDIDDTISKKIPFYNAAAKTYVQPYPKADVSNAKKITTYTPAIIKGMEQGYVALYQKCVHLGCRVPWCDTSQWFECPCHGSKYNRVGEKRGGPAPRGLDHFALTVSGGSITVDTGTIVTGPPIGTDTTGQAAEGAPCV
jgi:cytochrome b6-f complex iron-sulfur subunit